MPETPENLSIDDRLKFLLTSTESLHGSCQELHAAAVADRERAEADRARIEAQAQEMRKHQLALIAAIRAYLEGMESQ